MASSPEGALLETLVHLELDPVDLPANYQLLRVDVPDGVSCLDASQTFPLMELNNTTSTRMFGNDWIDRGRVALMIVPSAIIPVSSNVLLNPRHAEARQCRITDVLTVPYDTRLLQR